MSNESAREGLDRRRFLKVVGIGGAGAAVVSGCSTAQVEKLVPYMVQSEDQVPGVPTWYASTCTECAAGCGLHVKTREGRAIKLEGNPAHPVNASALCAHGQWELTKMFEEARRATLVKLAAHYAEAGAPKGEIVVIIAHPKRNAKSAMKRSTPSSSVRCRVA